MTYRALVRPGARGMIGARGAEASGGERGRGSVCDGARLMRQSIALLRFPPDQRVNNQLRIAGREDAMDEGDACKGGKRKEGGGGERSACDGA
jgi:hypothetical protein